jgi:hypothetical protein
MKARSPFVGVPCALYERAALQSYAQDIVTIPFDRIHWRAKLHKE